MASDRDPFDEKGDRSEDENPLAAFLAQFGIQPGPDGTFNLEDLMGSLQQAMQQFSAHMASFGSAEGGMNWTFTKDIARKVTAARGADPSPTSADQTEIRDAVGLADLWLDQQTDFDRIDAPPAAWSRAEWIEATFPIWRRLVDPVTTSLAAAITGMLNRQSSELAGLQSMMEPMMRAASSGMLAAQIGQSIGHLSTDVVSVSDIAIPLTERPRVALLPANVAAFAEGLDQTLADVRLYLALRETARQRLFAAVGWLGPQLLALIEKYARDIAIDAGAIEEALEANLSGDVSAEDIESLGTAVAGKLFEPVLTPGQRETLDKLETLVALVEGWVDDVVAATTASVMPGAVALLETVRRRRAAGGPAEQALKSLLNLELRPRRVRDAANVWAAVRSAKGIAARDAAWAHPDLVPSSGDLDDPLGFVQRGDAAPEPDALDAELAKLLDEESGRGDR